MSVNFANRDLRNRSFRQQNLTGASFRAADLRGCDFRAALLIDADLAKARLGRSDRLFLMQLAIAGLTSVVAANAIFRLVFDASGQTPQEPAWAFVVVLYGCLLTVGLAAGVSALRSTSSNQGAWLGLIAEMLAGVVVGFFYAGLAAGKNPLVAIAGAIATAGLVFLIRQKFKHRVAAIITAAIALVATYGAAFLLGIQAAALLHTGHLALGIGLALLALLYHWLTWRSLLRLFTQIGASASTSFAQANLTNANFSNVSLADADFSGAIGVLIPSHP